MIGWTKKLAGVKLPRGVEARINRDDATCFAMELRSGPMIACLSASASIRKPGRFAFSVSAGGSSYRDRTATHRTLDHARVLAASLAGDHVSQLLLACNLLTMHLADTSTTPAFPAPVRRGRKRAPRSGEGS